MPVAMVMADFSSKYNKLFGTIFGHPKLSDTLCTSVCTCMIHVHVQLPIVVFVVGFFQGGALSSACTYNVLYGACIHMYI